MFKKCIFELPFIKKFSTLTYSDGRRYGFSLLSWELLEVRRTFEAFRKLLRVGMLSGAQLPLQSANRGYQLIAQWRFEASAAANRLMNKPRSGMPIVTGPRKRDLMAGVIIIEISS